MKYKCKENDAIIEIGSKKDELRMYIDGETSSTIVGIKDMREALRLFDVFRIMPWVFWIKFNKRSWFTNFYYSRQANCLDIQVFKIHVSVGLPWLKCVVDSNIRDYNSLKFIKNTNDDNIIPRCSVLIGRYNVLEKMILL